MILCDAVMLGTQRLLLVEISYHVLQMIHRCVAPFLLPSCPKKTVLIRDGIHLHSEYSSRLQKGYFGVKVLFVNKKRTKPESKKAAGCVLALLKRVRTQRRPV